jgi:hypothetical protein
VAPGKKHTAEQIANRLPGRDDLLTVEEDALTKYGPAKISLISLWGGCVDTVHRASGFR